MAILLQHRRRASQKTTWRRKAAHLVVVDQEAEWQKGGPKDRISLWRPSTSNPLPPTGPSPDSQFSYGYTLSEYTDKVGVLATQSLSKSYQLTRKPISYEVLRRCLDPNYKIFHGVGAAPKILVQQLYTVSSLSINASLFCTLLIPSSLFFPPAQRLFFFF